MELPKTIEAEIMAFIDESEPTPKEILIERMKEHQWHKANIRAVLNYLFGLPACLFFKVGERIMFY